MKNENLTGSGTITNLQGGNPYTLTGGTQTYLQGHTTMDSSLLYSNPVIIDTIINSD